MAADSPLVRNGVDNPDFLPAVVRDLICSLLGDLLLARRFCPEPRPQACTMEYRPAIGYDKNGKKVGQFGNACHACGQDGVYYTLPEDGETR